MVISEVNRLSFNQCSKGEDKHHCFSNSNGDESVLMSLSSESTHWKESRCQNLNFPKQCLHFIFSWQALDYGCRQCMFFWFTSSCCQVVWPGLNWLVNPSLLMIEGFALWNKLRHSVCVDGLPFKELLMWQEFSLVMHKYSISEPHILLNLQPILLFTQNKIKSKS